MRVAEALQQNGIPKLDLEVLLAHALGHTRAWLLAHGEEEIPESALASFLASIVKRKAGEPVAYITREKEFYGRTFSVTPAVLVPRPSTETLVEETLRMLNGGEGRVIEADAGISILSARFSSSKPVTIVDSGTGSGVIAVSLLKEGWSGGVVAIDISNEALDIAKENAARYSVGERITFVQGDGAATVAGMKEGFLLVSNPPYIPEGETLGHGVEEFEPAAALFAGREGLDVIDGLVRAARANPSCVGIVLELRSDQVDAVKRLLA